MQPNQYFSLASRATRDEAFQVLLVKYNQAGVVDCHIYVRLSCTYDLGWVRQYSKQIRNEAIRRLLRQYYREKPLSMHRLVLIGCTDDKQNGFEDVKKMPHLRFLLSLSLSYHAYVCYI